MMTLRILALALFVSGCATKPERRYFPEGSLSSSNAKFLAETFSNAREPPIHEYPGFGNRRYRFVHQLSIPQAVVVITVIDSGFGQVLRTRMIHAGGICQYDHSKIMNSEEFDSFVAAVKALEDSSPKDMNPDIWSIFTVLDGSSYSLEVWSKGDGMTPAGTRVYAIADPSHIELTPQAQDLLRSIVPEATVDLTSLGAYVSAFKTLIDHLKTFSGIYDLICGNGRMWGSV